MLWQKTPVRGNSLVILKFAVDLMLQGSMEICDYFFPEGNLE